MKDKSINLFQIIIILLLQLICEHYVYLGKYISIALLPIIVLSLPLKIKSAYGMLTGFVIGFISDLLTNGIIGISAASMVVLAGSRSLFLSLAMNHESMNRNAAPSSETLGPKLFIAYVSITYLIYILTYNFIDIMTISDLGYFFLRVIISFAVNMPLAFLINYIIRRM